MANNSKSNKRRQTNKKGANKTSPALIVAFALIVVALVACIVAAVSLMDTSQTASAQSIAPSYAETVYGDFKDTCAYAEIEMMDGGRIVLELYPDVAPITVANFVKLAKEGFYDGLIFHRVISGFMIQGGDPMGTGIGGSDEDIFGEFASNGFENNLSHVRGVISMARSGYDPNSASSQFFICQADCTRLDGDYAAFGNVISGMDVVDAIASVATNPNNDKPYEDIVIKTIKILQDIPVKE